MELTELKQGNTQPSCFSLTLYIVQCEDLHGSCCMLLVLEQTNFVLCSQTTKGKRKFYSNLNESERNRLWGLPCLLALMFQVVKTAEGDQIIENLMESGKNRLSSQNIKKRRAYLLWRLSIRFL